MQKKQQLKEEKIFLGTLGTIATAYEEISVMRMRETRKSIEQSRDFVERLKQMFESLKYSNPILVQKNKSGKTKGQAKVLITANSKFYGDVLRRIFNSFIKSVDKKGDLFVIGKVGKTMISDLKLKIDYKYFDIPDDGIKGKDIVPLLTELDKYSTIEVYYAQLKTMIQQEIMSTKIPSIYTLVDSEESKQKNEEKTDQPKYIFEPSVEEIAEFLDDNTTIALVKQTLYETQLARYASRIQAMDSLLHSVDDDLKILKRKEKKVKRLNEDMKQQERMSGIFLWRN